MTQIFTIFMMKVGERMEEEARQDTETQRKPWHAPEVRWLDMRETKLSIAGSHGDGALTYPSLS